MFIKETNTVYRITSINEISYLDDVIIKKVGDIQPVDYSPNFDFNFYLYKPKQDKQAIIVDKKKYIQQDLWERNVIL